MCYIPGSVEHLTSICPMCKVFRPSASRCPHIKDTCTNRENHPRHDVVFMRNAEVQTFNGCGYCKWVRFVNSPKGQAMISASGGSGPHPNNGWPGCCRAPASNEHKLVPAADWPSVSIVHHVNMPPEIRAILDKIIASANAANRAGPLMPPVERRDSGGNNNSQSGSPTSTTNSSGSGKSALSPKSSNSPSSIVPGILAAKNRAPNSPPQTSSSPVSPRSAGSGGGGVPSAVNPTSPRTAASVDRGGPRAERSPVRKNPDLEASISRRGTVRRTTITGPSSPFSNGGGSGNPKGDSPTEPIRKTSLLSSSTTSLSGSNRTSSPKSSPPSSRSGDGSGSGSSNNPTPTSTISRAQARNNSGSSSSSSSSKPSLEVSMSGLKLVSNPPSSASSSGGSSSDFTVTSDGAFTDYLSDESEAELQRQAEARAALVAQNYAEEQEFRAARERLTHVDLRPPRAWDSMQQRSQAKV